MAMKKGVPAAVSQDRRSVLFVADTHARTIHCAITVQALEQHFWAPAGANDERLLKVFDDGYARIVARAERKYLTRPGDEVTLDVDDFDSLGTLKSNRA
jgi:hypothetical protein